MSQADAAQILAVSSGAEWDEVRAAYRAKLLAHHPDRAGEASSAQAAQIIEAYRVLDRARHQPPEPPSARQPPPRRRPAPPQYQVGDAVPAVVRLNDDTLLLGAPGEEVFRLLLDAAHNVGEITYVDRSVPILEVLCQFLGEPATSLLLTLQGRSNGTEVFATVESIEDRPAPPVASVVDLLELALHRRLQPDLSD
jgi:hypothetical protein